VLDGGQIVYVARSASARVMAVDLAVGSRLPAYCTSMGRVLLAALPPTDLTAFLKTTALKRLTLRTVATKSGLLKIVGEVPLPGICAWSMRSSKSASAHRRSRFAPNPAASSQP